MKPHQEAVNLFLTNCDFSTCKDVILPKCFTLMVLRFTHEKVEDTWLKVQDTLLQADQTDAEGLPDK